MGNRLALRIVGLLILVPTTLVAAFGTLPGIALTLGAIHDGFPGLRAQLWLAAFVAGWFGIVTLWRLYYVFLRDRLSFNRRIAWMGLACGSMVSVALIATSGGLISFRILFFGWPLLAIVYFALALLRSRAKSDHSPKQVRENARALSGHRRSG